MSEPRKDVNKRIYQNEVITDTVAAQDPYSGTGFATSKPDYALSEADHVRLKHGKSAWLSLAPAFFGLTLGYGLSLLPKWISRYTDGKSQVTRAESIAFWICIAISVVLFIVFRYVLPNESKAVWKDMATHFKNAPKSRQNIKRLK